MHVTRSILVFSLAGLPGCLKDNTLGSGNPNCSPTATQVCMASGSYNPLTLTIAAGTTVAWKDGSGIAHTVTSDPGSNDAFDLAVLPGATVARQFNTSGTFTYHCQYHGAPGNGMHGTITVN